MTASVDAVAREEGVRVDVRQTALESTSALSQAIESASEWNSLLMSARAERGPQWDIGTQQFLVDELSDLYYDPTDLRGHLKDQQQSSSADEPSSSAVNATPSRSHRQPPPDMHNSPRMHRSSMPPNTPLAMHASPGPGAHGQFFGSPVTPRHPHGGFSGGAPGMQGAIPPAQFYGGAQGAGPGMGMGMNMGMNMGMGMGAGVNPAAMGMGMGMPMGMNNMNMAAMNQMGQMGHPGMGMGGMQDGPMSPVTPGPRRMTRGMSMEDFGGMQGGMQGGMPGGMPGGMHG